MKISIKFTKIYVRSHIYLKLPEGENSGILFIIFIKLSIKEHFLRSIIFFNFSKFLEKHDALFN